MPWYAPPATPAPDPLAEGDIISNCHFRKTATESVRRSGIIHVVVELYCGVTIGHRPTARPPAGARRLDAGVRHRIFAKWFRWRSRWQHRPPCHSESGTQTGKQKASGHAERHEADGLVGADTTERSERTDAGRAARALPGARSRSLALHHRSSTLHHRSSTLHQIHGEVWCLYL